MKIPGKLITVDIKQVEPNDYNFNEMTPALLAKERESIRRFGIVKPPLVWEPRPGRYIIIDGEHRWKVLSDDGAETITIRNLGKIQEKDAKQLTILLNEIRGEPDYGKLTALFGSLTVSAEEIANILPWNMEEISAMSASADFDWDEFDFSDSGGTSSPGLESENITILCRVTEEDAPLIEEKAEILCEKHGFFDKSTAVQMGMLFEHLLAVINNSQ